MALARGPDLWPGLPPDLAGYSSRCWPLEVVDNGGNAVRRADPGESSRGDPSQLQPAQDHDEPSQTMDVSAASDAASVPDADGVVERGVSRRSERTATWRWRPFHTGVVLGALVAVAVTLLIIQNGQSVRINWVAFHFKAPEWIVLFVTAAAGAVVWELIRLGFRRRGGRKAKPTPA